MISFANTNNSFQFSNQFSGENTEITGDKEIVTTEFSALLTAFCVVPQLPTPIPTPISNPIVEQISEQFTTETTAIKESNFVKPTDSQNSPIALPVNEQSPEVFKFIPNENLQLPVNVKSETVAESRFALTTNNNLPSNNLLPSDNELVLADNKSILIDNKFGENNNEIEIIALPENNLTKTDLTKNILAKAEVTETDQTAVKPLKLDWQPIKFESETTKPMTEIKLEQVSTDFHKVSQDIAAPLEFIKNEKEVLPVQTNQIDLETVGQTEFKEDNQSYLVKPIDLNFSTEKVLPESQNAFNSLQNIFRGIIKLPVKTSKSAIVENQNPFAQINVNHNLVQPILVKNYPVQTDLIQDNLVQTKVVKSDLAQTDLIQLNSVQPDLAPLNPIASDKIQANPKQQNSNELNILAPDVATPNLFLNSPKPSVQNFVKAAAKVDENNFLETLTNVSATLEQPANLGVAKQTAKIPEFKLETAPLEQIKEAIIELTNKINSVREPQIIKLRLRPAELGAVEVKLERAESGKINARLITTLESTQHLFTQNISQLREALTEAGWQVDQLEVSCQSFQNAANSGNNDNPSPTTPEKGETFASQSNSALEIKTVSHTEIRSSQSNRLLSVRA